VHNLLLNNILSITWRFVEVNSVISAKVWWRQVKGSFKQRFQLWKNPLGCHSEGATRRSLLVKKTFFRVLIETMAIEESTV